MDPGMLGIGPRPGRSVWRISPADHEANFEKWLYACCAWVNDSVKPKRSASIGDVKLEALEPKRSVDPGRVMKAGWKTSNPCDIPIIGKADG